MKKSALVLFSVAFLLVAACGSQAAVEQTASAPSAETDSAAPPEQSDTESESEPAGDQAETQAAEPEPEPAAEPAEEAAAADPTPVPTVDTTSDAALLGSDDWCAVARQVEDSVVGGDDADFISDPAAVEQAYVAAGALLDQAVRVAPPAIAADVQASAATFTELNGLLAAAEWDFLAVDLVAMQQAAEGMVVPGYNIEKYNYEVCGIGEDPGDAPDLMSDEFDEPLPEGSARDFMVESFVASGFSEAEALCLADSYDIANPEALTDADAMFEAFEDCGL